MSISRLMQMGAAGAGGAGGWDLSQAVYGQSFPEIYLSDKDTQMSAIFFKPDGTKLYMLGYQNDRVYEFDLTTAWDTSTAQYVQFFSVQSQDTLPRGLFFKSDGTKMFVVGDAGDNLYEYDLSTAWDISTASYLRNNDIGGSSSTNLTGLFFKPDGSQVYFVSEFTDSVYQARVYYPWETTLIFSYSSLSVSSVESQPRDVTFNDDGTKMYLVGTGTRRVAEYSLSTAYTITSASLVRVLQISISDVFTPTGISFKSDGTEMYIVDNGDGSGRVVKYTLSTAWDISTATINYPTADYFSVNAQATQSEAIAFKTDGTKMYIVGSSGDDVDEYSLSTPWQVSSASYVTNFSVVTQDNTPEDIAFKPDGTKMYVVGSGSGNINEYNLSTAWDISTAVYSQNFSVATQEALPHGLFFKDDGTKVYIVGQQYDQVREYNLSTAWDISTASYLQGFSVSSQDGRPTAVSFKPDGKKMYVIGDDANDVFEYDLTTAWDISTASYSQSFHSLYDDRIQGLFFRPTGRKMFVIGNRADAVFAYDL